MRLAFGHGVHAHVVVSGEMDLVGKRRGEPFVCDALVSASSREGPVAASGSVALSGGAAWEWSPRKARADKNRSLPIGRGRIVVGHGGTRRNF